MPLTLAVDANVLIKAYIPEGLSEETDTLLLRVENRGVSIIAPDLIYSEVGNTLWKKYKLKELTASALLQI